MNRNELLCLYKSLFRTAGDCFWEKVEKLLYKGLFMKF